MPALIRLKLVIALLLLAGEASSFPIYDAVSTYRLKEHLTYYYDPLGTTVVDELIGSNKNFVKEPPVGGIYKGSVWARVELTNRSSLERFVVEYPWIIAKLSVYCVGSDNIIYGKNDLGYAFPSRNNLVKNSSILTEVSIRQDETITLLMQFQHDDAVNFEVYLHTPDRFNVIDHDRQLGFGLYFGIICGLFMYNIFLFLSLRDYKYFFYLGVLLFTDCLAIMIMYGLATQYVFSSEIFMKYEIANIIFALSMVFNLLFSRSMLNTRETLPSFFKFSNIFILVIAFLVFGSIAFDGILLPAEIVNILYVLTSTIILGLVIFCSYKRDRSGIFLLGSWLMMLIGSFIGMLCIHGLVDENFFTRYAFLFGTGSEGILLSISLADRINVMKKDRERYLVEKSKLESVVDILGILDNIEVKKEGSIKTPHFTDKTMKVIVHRVMSILQQIKDFYALKEERNRYQAIANTVQMLAHDVRKPFIQLEYIIYFLKNEQKNGNGENIYFRFMPMLQNSISYIDGMLIDIMEIGSASKPRLGYCRASDIIKQSILKVFTFELESNIEFRYNFQHTKLLYVQDTKVERAFMNILSNALEAMKKVGDIWIETSDIVVEGKSYISFKIGNSNSYLSEEERSHIFEGFYTSGKRSGFGLGLAIVKKVVDDHGGTISCRSSLELGVEFILNLPSGIKRDNADHFSLPRASKDVFSVWSTQSSECERTKHVIT